jgi:hypothetical protein
MAGFQFSPIAGVIPLTPEAFDANAMHGAAVALPPVEPYDPEAIPEESGSRVAPPPRAAVAKAAPAVVLPAPASARASAPAISPRTVLKAARARVKEIKAELKRMRGLQTELGQLERMLAATKKPLASLTPINSRRVS